MCVVDIVLNLDAQVAGGLLGPTGAGENALEMIAVHVIASLRPVAVLRLEMSLVGCGRREATSSIILKNLLHDRMAFDGLRDMASVLLRQKIFVGVPSLWQCL